MSMRLFFTPNINIFCQEYQYEIVIAFYSDITQPFFHFSDEEKEKTAVHFRKYEIETFVSATDPPKTPENLIWSAPEVFRGDGLLADVPLDAVSSSDCNFVFLLFFTLRVCTNTTKYNI